MLYCAIVSTCVLVVPVHVVPQVPQVPQVPYVGILGAVLI